MTGDLKRLPLADIHEAAGARFGAFAGWHMPVTYTLGVLKEHLWTRACAGLFDISHMRLFRVEGAEAAGLLARACPLDPLALGLGQSKLTFLLAPDAGILDDLIVTRLGPDRFHVVANAGNAAADEAHLRAVARGFSCEIDPLDRVLLALQGPAAEAALREAGVDALPRAFMTGAEPRPGWFVTRSGYTGEDGFEIALPEADARQLVARLMNGGRVRWAGLAARDSLRLEAGLCLHGQDITPHTTPADAAVLWAIPKPLRASGPFIGAAALAQAVASKPSVVRVGLKPDGRQPVRAGAELTNEAGAAVGTVTSGGFGPSVNAPVAMGYVARDLASSGTSLLANVRGSLVPVAVHPLPFVPHRYRKG